MPTIDRYNNTALSSTNRSYIAVSAFGNDFFTYTVSGPAPPSFVVTGQLTAVGGVCPKGRILRENGKKLYPNANPGVSVYMVGVYDAVSFVSGFIDPNSPVFAPFNTDKPTYLEDSTDPGPGGLLDKGAPVYTNSSVEAGTTITAGTSMTAGTTISAGTIVTAGTIVHAGTGMYSDVGQIRVGTITGISGQTSITIDPRLSQVFDVQLPNNATSCTITSVSQAELGEVPGAIIYLIVTNNYGNTRNIDFNQYFKTQNAGIFTLAANAIYTFSFICNGSNLFQIGQATQISQ